MGRRVTTHCSIKPDQELGILEAKEKSDQGEPDLTPKKIRVRDEGRRVNQELVDLDLRSTFKVVLSVQTTTFTVI